MKMHRCVLPHQLVMLSVMTAFSQIQPASDDEDEEESKAGICIRAASLNLVDLAGSERVGCGRVGAPTLFSLCK